ncbi:GIN domain-containing protein [Massilia suwonensis]|uniref:GIN domain-containing protein n=1 Tax=Massilia suwonensis TaxID=648895 RepID=A0ABW0MP74_9BURK
MNKFWKFGLAALGLLALMRLATAAPESTSETRPLDARVVRVKIDGVVDLRVRQGSPASLVLSGDPRWIAQMTTMQSGDTVVIGTEMHEMRMGRKNGVRADLVLPNLREVSSESVGMTDISGFKGEELELSLDGAGSMNVNADFRVISASLGGVGSMKLAGLNAERITLDLQGAGYVTLAGRSKSLKAELGGLGGLDAQQFAADSVTLELSGLGNATITANQSANLNLSGMGSVTVYGKPLNRRVSVDGLGKVSWK